MPQVVQRGGERGAEEGARVLLGDHQLARLRLQARRPRTQWIAGLEAFHGGGFAIEDAAVQPARLHHHVGEDARNAGPAGNLQHAQRTGQRRLHPFAREQRRAFGVVRHNEVDKDQRRPPAEADRGVETCAGVVGVQVLGHLAAPRVASGTVRQHDPCHQRQVAHAVTRFSASTPIPAATRCAWWRAAGRCCRTCRWPSAAQIFLREHDWVRRALMFEPRGHDVHVRLDPVSADARRLRPRRAVHRGQRLPADVRPRHHRHGDGGDRGRAGHAARAGPAGARDAGRAGGRWSMCRRARSSSRCGCSTCRPTCTPPTCRSTCPAWARLRIDVAYGGNYYAIIEPQPNWPGLDGMSAGDIQRLQPAGAPRGAGGGGAGASRGRADRGREPRHVVRPAAQHAGARPQRGVLRRQGDRPLALRHRLLGAHGAIGGARAAGGGRGVRPREHHRQPCSTAGSRARRRSATTTRSGRAWPAGRGSPGTTRFSSMTAIRWRTGSCSAEPRRRETGSRSPGSPTGDMSATSSASGCRQRQAEMAVTEGVDNVRSARRRADHRQRVGRGRPVAHPLRAARRGQAGQIVAGQTRQPARHVRSWAARSVRRTRRRRRCAGRWPAALRRICVRRTPPDGPASRRDRGSSVL